MPIYASLTSAYAKAIYLDGTRRFSSIRPEYVEPTKQYGADNYTIEQIDNALAQGWITTEEHQQTLAYRA
ncbi:ribulose bisphosphate carboxylase small subunit [Paenibacillus sp. V4I3]|uniref:hypothetical protein n=1 Tax=Paenibacillus sp. V4I3 TaxID=3042305 RepID=UPI00277ECA9B|nr:hypothetical protein [Paenibacillus sp. V4I3]MDQ0873798.1 ribulose bisphosphate carboxylase small subunit [Paenibacillus sp. V4I3]